eukprot:6034-Heterococcus_DN1.PRE.4
MHTVLWPESLAPARVQRSCPTIAVTVSKCKRFEQCYEFMVTIPQRRRRPSVQLVRSLWEGSDQVLRPDAVPVQPVTDHFDPALHHTGVHPKALLLLSVAPGSAMCCVI